MNLFSFLFLTEETSLEASFAVFNFKHTSLLFARLEYQLKIPAEVWYLHEFMS